MDEGVAGELVESISQTCLTIASTSDQREPEDISTGVETTSINRNTQAIAGPLIASSDSDEMKRAHAKKLIEKYFYQLSDGCGNPNCTNQNCASSGELESLTPNQAAARAIQLFSEEAPLCGMPSAKLARTYNEPVLIINPNASENTFDAEPPKTNDVYR